MSSNKTGRRLDNLENIYTIQVVLIPLSFFIEKLIIKKKFLEIRPDLVTVFKSPIGFNPDHT